MNRKSRTICTAVLACILVLTAKPVVTGHFNYAYNLAWMLLIMPLCVTGIVNIVTNLKDGLDA